MLSVTKVHPYKATAQNEMPFGKNTRVIPSNTGAPVPPPSKRRYGGSEPPVHSEAAHCQIALALVNYFKTV